MKNGFVESLNGRLRDECLNGTPFIALSHARFVLAVWQHDYDTVRPYSKLGGKTTAKITGERVCGHASDTLPFLQISIIKARDSNSEW